ncbi:hypothetical protein [Streptomyces sp. NPDC091371]|uniref:hypothetical protein n=1 Tax=Streptomyces sp. NPDC091371 TaxID=3155303 RepID=UPI00343050F8
MADLIRALVLWARLWFGPSTGAAHRAHPQAPTPRPRTHPLPVPRSPYGLDGPLDGDETPLIRPYVRVHEQREERARQRQRRLAMLLAADFGIDLDTHLVGARGAA